MANLVSPAKPEVYHLLHQLHPLQQLDKPMLRKISAQC